MPVWVLARVSHWFPLASPETGPDWAPGREQFVTSTCLLCPSHCGIRGRLIDGNLVGIDGNPLHPVSQGGPLLEGARPVCRRCTIRPVSRRPSNGTAPISGKSRGTPPSSASPKSSARFAMLGRADAVAWLGGEIPGSMGELVEQFLSGAYGSPHLIREDYGDGAERVIEFAHGVKTRPAFDLDRSDLILSFGAPLSESWWCLPQAAQSQGRFLLASAVAGCTSTPACPVRRSAPMNGSGFAREPTVFLRCRSPYVLLKEGLYDSDYVHQSVTGFEDWEDAEGRTVEGYRSLILRHGRPDDVSDRIGLEADKIVQLAKQFGRGGAARRSVGPRGRLVARWPVSGPRDSRAQRAGRLDPAPRWRFLAVAARTPVAGADGPVRSAPPARRRIHPELFRLGRPDSRGRTGPRIEVLFMYLTNPVASAPDPDKVRRALEKIPLIVSFSPFLDETSPPRASGDARPHLPGALARCSGAVHRPVFGLGHRPTRRTAVARHSWQRRRLAGLGFADRRECGRRLPLGIHGNAPAKTRGSAGRGPPGEAPSRPTSGAKNWANWKKRGWWLPHGLSAAGFWRKLVESGGWFDPFHDDYGRGRGFRAGRRGGSPCFPNRHAG